MTDIKFPGEDPISQGVFNYHFHRDNSPIRIHSDGFDTDEVLPPTFSEVTIKCPSWNRKRWIWLMGKCLT